MNFKPPSLWGPIRLWGKGSTLSGINTNFSTEAIVSRGLITIANTEVFEQSNKTMRGIKSMTKLGKVAPTHKM